MENVSKVKPWGEELTVDIALAFICLSNEQIRNMSTNMILVARSVTAEDLLQPEPRQISK